ncbi:MAG: hypothetical protein FWD64_09765 [Acidobacteriaceae bacterium]|nr:hypothetical protein [Acidobacteriaceae bacterium]
MKRIERKWSALAASLTMMAMIAFPALSRAQEHTASIHGTVLNPAGLPVTNGQVKLTKDHNSDEKQRKYLYTFDLDAAGAFKGTGVVPGTYLLIVSDGARTLDFLDGVDLRSGEDKMVAIDMSRKEYLDKMTPEERKALEEWKKQNAQIAKDNEKINNLNTLLNKSRADTSAGNDAVAQGKYDVAATSYDSAATAMQQATTLKPMEALLWEALADAQLGQAEVAAKSASAAGKSPSAPDIIQKYSDAVASYKKAIELNAAAKTPSAEVAGVANSQLGKALSASGDPAGAVNAYESAAKADPSKAGMYYFNEAVTLYNNQHMDEATVAADKAIAADPAKAMAYYIKGQALIPKAGVDPQTGKIAAPPGTIEAYQKFLELVPTGPRADEVKSILQGIGADYKANYKSGKKK